MYVAHTRLHLHLCFASEWYAEWTDAVKLKRNHREFLRGEKGGWLSREDLFSSPWRRGTAVIGGTFLSKCSFLSRHSRERGEGWGPRSHPRGHVLPREDNLYTATLCYHSLPESIKHHEIRGIKRTRAMSNSALKSGRNVIFLQHTLQISTHHLENIAAVKQQFDFELFGNIVGILVRFKMLLKKKMHFCSCHNYFFLCKMLTTQPAAVSQQ